MWYGGHILNQFSVAFFFSFSFICLGYRSFSTRNIMCENSQKWNFSMFWVLLIFQFVLLKESSLFTFHDIFSVIQHVMEKPQKVDRNRFIYLFIYFCFAIPLKQACCQMRKQFLRYLILTIVDQAKECHKGIKRRHMWSGICGPIGAAGTLPEF